MREIDFLSLRQHNPVDKVEHKADPMKLRAMIKERREQSKN